MAQIPLRSPPAAGPHAFGRPPSIAGPSGTTVARPCTSRTPATRTPATPTPATPTPGDPDLGDVSTLCVDDTDDDPVLLGPDGLHVDPWRQGYPYDEHLFP